MRGCLNLVRIPKKTEMTNFLGSTSSFKKNIKSMKKSKKCPFTLFLKMWKKNTKMAI